MANLYYGGFGRYQYYTVANTEKEAIEQIQNKNSLSHLPVTVKHIDNVDGFSIVLVKDDEPIEDYQEDGDIDNDEGNDGDDVSEEEPVVQKEKSTRTVRRKATNRRGRKKV